MKRFLTYLLICCAALCGSAQHASAQIYDADGQYVDTIFHDHINRQAEDFVEAYVVVAQPGDYLYTALGHAAYHLKCPVFGLDYYFSMEGENAPDKVLRFMAGDLKMGFFSMTPDEFLQYYAEENRGVTEWKLNLTPTQKQRLWEVLDKHVSEGFVLPYDYYYRCCAITEVNVMNEVVGKDNICYEEPWPEKFKRTPREFVIDAIKDTHPWTLFFMGILAGWDVDWNIPNERKFIIPMDDVEAWQRATVNGVTLLDSTPIEILPANDRAEAARFTPLLVSLALLILALLSFASCRFENRVLHIAGACIDWTIIVAQMGIGLVMTYLIFVSDLCCTGWNWYYIAVCPLPLLAWHWRRKWAIPYAALLLIWIVVMIAWPHMIAQWSHIVLTMAFTVVVIKQYFLAKSNLDKEVVNK